MKNLAILIGVPVALWGVLLYPGLFLDGDDAIRHSGVALALCLVPAVATLVATQRFATTPDARTMATLGSSAVRMGVVLGVGMVLHSKWPEAYPNAFLYWLAAFYLVILGLEVGLLVRQPPGDGGQPDAGPSIK